jgi:Protein of unknown function (DUF3040)
MLSDDDRGALADIERHLQQDPSLRRSFGGVAARSASWIRRGWLTVLLTSLVLTVGMALLGVANAALESAALGAVAWTMLSRIPSKPAGRIDGGPIPDRRH